MQVEPNGKAVIYARVSTDKGVQDPENQLVILRDWAGKLGLVVVREYVDYASSGSGDEVGRRQMFADFKTGKFQRHTLLFFSLDRFTREGVLPTLTYLNTITSQEIIYKSYAEQWLDSAGPFKDAIIAIMATLARQEKIRIGERTRAGLARVKTHGSKSGKPIGRPKIDLNLDEIREMLKTASERSVAKSLGLPLSTLRTRLHGRVEKKAKAIWSEPVHGRLDENEIFVEDPRGQVVIRYDRTNGKPYCLNHQVELNDCRQKHLEQEVTV